MRESESTEEQVYKSLDKTFREPQNSFWRVSSFFWLPFTLLTAVFKPSSPVNSGVAIILRLAILCGFLAAAYYLLPLFKDEPYETGQVEVIWRE